MIKICAREQKHRYRYRLHRNAYTLPIADVAFIILSSPLMLLFPVVFYYTR